MYIVHASYQITINVNECNLSCMISFSSHSTTACDCNNRSTSCEYNFIDMTVSCTGCLHGTSGTHCENCATGYYLNPVGNASVTSGNNCTGPCDTLILMV